MKDQLELIYPSSGACDCVDEYHICRLVLSSLCVGAFVAAGIWWCSFCRLKHNSSDRTVVLQTAKRTPPNTSHNKSSNTQQTKKKTTDVEVH